MTDETTATFNATTGQWVREDAEPSCHVEPIPPYAKAHVPGAGALLSPAHGIGGTDHFEKPIRPVPNSGSPAVGVDMSPGPDTEVIYDYYSCAQLDVGPPPSHAADAMAHAMTAMKAKVSRSEAENRARDAAPELLAALKIAVKYDVAADAGSTFEERVKFYAEAHDLIAHVEGTKT